MIWLGTPKDFQCKQQRLPKILSWWSRIFAIDSMFALLFVYLMKRARWIFGTFCFLHSFKRENRIRFIMKKNLICSYNKLEWNYSKIIDWCLFSSSLFIKKVCESSLKIIVRDAKKRGKVTKKGVNTPPFIVNCVHPGLDYRI